jgi:hypothetical protein
MHRPQNLYSYGGSTLQGRWLINYFVSLISLIDSPTSLTDAASFNC